MGNSRQTKGRSRTGCKQCRLDRKKCDEVRPHCGRCTSRRICCDFDRPLGVRLGNRRRSRSLLSPTNTITTTDGGGGGCGGSGGIAGAHSPLTATSSVYPPLTEYTSPEEGSSSAPMSVRPIPQSAPPPFGMIGSPALETGTMAASLPDVDPFHDLLRDLFGSSVPDMTAGMSLIFGPSGPVQSELGDLTVEPPPFHAISSPNVEPRDVQRRFNAPLDPRAALRATISAPIIETLSDIEARLFYHYIDVQATISIAIETDDNPMSKHFIPVALSSALAGQNQDNPAFHALKASAATHRANLMDRTGTEGAEVFRDIAHAGRKAAYELLATRLETLPTATVAEREQFGGALCMLVSLAVVDGNARLLPRLLEMYAPYCKARDRSAHEEFFIIATTFWQTWNNFTLAVVHNQPPIPPIADILARPCPDVEYIFAIPPVVVAQHTRVYALIRAYRSTRPAEALGAQIEADELITGLEHSLAQDLEAPELRDVSNPAERRRAIGRVLHHAALRVLLLREIFHCPRDDFQIQQCVRHGLSVLGGVKWGTEAGMLVPLVILSTAALGHYQRQYRTFMFRLCWKGSAGPQAALGTLDMVMEDPDLDWKGALMRMGPVILV